jgi:hypothetical protein
MATTKVLAAFFCAHFGEVDVQVANRVSPEFIFRRALPIFVQGQAAAAVLLKAAVQCRA